VCRSYGRLPTGWAANCPSPPDGRGQQNRTAIPKERRYSRPVEDLPPVPSVKMWRKGRVSNPHVPKDLLASNEPPLGRISAYISDGGPPRSRTEFHRFAAGALTVCLRSSKLAGDQRIELCNAGFGVRRSPNRACPPCVFKWWRSWDSNPD
jgi:hypothetical protein